jgi:ribonuclease R
MLEYRDVVLRHVNAPNYRPVKPKVIAKKLGIEGDAVTSLKRTIRKLVKAGELAYGPSHLVYPGKGPVAKGPASKGPVGKTTPRSTPAQSGRKLPPQTDAQRNLSPEQAFLPQTEHVPKRDGTEPDETELDETELEDADADAEDSDAEDAAAGPGQLHSESRAQRDTARRKFVVGTFRRNAGGFGFVRPEGTLPSEGRDADVFVPAAATGDASSGDTVRIRLSKKRGRMGKPEGEIVDIVQRATNRFVGVYYEEVGVGMVQIDGRLFSNPIVVGDPGAKGVQTDDKVVIEMVRYPSHSRHGEGVIVEVLGKRGTPGIDTASIIREFDLPGEFAEDALDEARRQAERFDEQIAPTPLGVVRHDLTAETIITIDPVTARDFDDAISLSRLDNGHWLLGVHIADVSHFVQPKTPLDREAHERATSVYLPDRVIPMLPEIISNNLASLQPERVRYALTARIEFSAAGLRIATDVIKSAIKSCRRFTYEEVDQWLWARNLTRPATAHRSAASSGPETSESTPSNGSPAAESSLAKSGVALPPPPEVTPAVATLLGQMFELAMILRRRRIQRGALELSMPEVKIDLDRDGNVSGAHVEQNTESHQIIEEFMLAANEAVAEMLSDRGLIFLRRVHGAPDPRKLKALTAFVKELEIPADSLQDRFALQKLLADIRSDPREHAVNFAVLRSLQRAIYSPEEEGHYALASDNYCHFTSPIRRYPDLTIHRLIEDLLAGKPPHQELPTLLALGDHCSEREQRATDAERELTRVKLLNYMATRVGEELDGVVTGVESFGLFIMGTDVPAEGFVHISGLVDDYYRYDRAGHVIRGLKNDNAYRLGDPVRVAVASVDVDRRELDFRLLGRRGGPQLPAAGRDQPPSTAGSRGKRGGSSAGPRKPRSPGKPKTAGKPKATGRSGDKRRKRKT